VPGRFDREIPGEIHHRILRLGQKRPRLIQRLFERRGLAPDQHFRRDHPVTEPGPAEITGIRCLGDASVHHL
jgi:hypothetical protein